MKPVVHVITTINMGGAEKQLVTLIAEQTRSSRNVLVVYLKGEPELADAIISAGGVIDDSLANKSPLLQSALLYRILKKNREAVIHAHLPRAEIMTAIAAHKSKFVVSRHNSEEFFPGAPKVISKLLSRFVCYRASQVIAISSAVRDFLISNQEVSRKTEIQVIHYGLRKKEANSNFQSDMKVGRNKTIQIGTVARLVPQKDLPTLLKAYSTFRLKYPNSELCILGDGYLRDDLKTLSENLGIASSVNWLGRTSLVGDFIKALDLFVLTSKYEGFGLVLLEAMAEGTPIVAARNSAIPEVLGDKYEAMFETSNSAELCEVMISCIEPRMSDKLTEYLKHRLQLFSPENMTIKMDLAYESVER